MNIFGKPSPVKILAIGVHPDDIELSCSGTLLKHIQKGYSVGLLDLTLGEYGTRGNPQLRSEEAKNAAEKLGASFRVQLDLEDCFFHWGKTELLKIITVIRTCKPDLVFANALSDRHPDHERSAKLVADALFYSGLQKIETRNEQEQVQDRWRPKQVLHYIQDHQLTADIICDISDVIEEKINLIKCFSSQFYSPDSNELDTPISGQSFFELIKSKCRIYGRLMNVDFAEAFNCSGPIALDDLVRSLK